MRACGEGVPRPQQHSLSGLATLPSVGAVPLSPHIMVDCTTCSLFCVDVCLLYVWFVCVLFVPSVLWRCRLGLLTCKNRLPYNLYCGGGDIKHCSIQSSPIVFLEGLIRACCKSRENESLLCEITSPYLLQCHHQSLMHVRNMEAMT